MCIRDRQKGSFRPKRMRENFEAIAADFAALPVRRVPKVRVGIVGEIYIKYAPLGNNNLEEFLLSEGCEPVVPGIMDFIIFKCDNRVEDHRLYGGKGAVAAGASLLMKYCRYLQRQMIEVIRQYPAFRVPCTFDHLKALVKGYLGYGNKMGEGWLLTGEMLELIDSGIDNIGCTQPFGCRPKHVVGKEVYKRQVKEPFIRFRLYAVDGA